MSDMDGVIDFITRYVQAEHEEQVASYTERNYSRYKKAQKAVEAFFAPRVTSGFSRTAFESDLYFAQYAPKAERLSARTLFLVRRYAGDPTHGDLYRAYLSGNHKGDDGYDRNVYVAMGDGAWRIVAVYGLDREDEEEDDELWWDRMRGSKLRDLGPAVETRRLAPPAPPLHRAEYDGDEGSPMVSQ